MKVIYQTEATATGDGRAGEVRTNDGQLAVNLVRPAEQDGTPGTNPEQLFAAGYAACFHSALRTIARRKDQNVDDSTVTARVALVLHEGGKYGLDVEMAVALPGIERAMAEELVEEAHGVCPYSRAIDGNVEVRRTVKS